MFSQGDQVLFSASDLVSFIGCAHAILLDIGNLEQPHSFATTDEATALLQEKGLEHECANLQSLQDQELTITEIPSARSLQERAASTRAAMNEGADVIDQAHSLLRPEMATRTSC